MSILVFVLFIANYPTDIVYSESDCKIIQKVTGGVCKQMKVFK